MNRETLLKLLVGVAVGLWLLDYIVIEPTLGAWSAQTERIAAVRKKVTRGQGLLERERTIRGRWTDMQRSDLPEDNSAAEEAVSKAMARWTQNSRLNFSTLNYQWHSHDEGYDTFECRATVSGDQPSLGRLLYEVETDSLPARLEEAEITAKDSKGQQLSMALRFTFVRLNEGASPASGTAPTRRVLQ